MWTIGIVLWQWDTPLGETCSLSFILSITPSPSLHLFVCVCLSLSPTQNHTLTITPHRATKDTPTPYLMHTHPHHTQGIQWLPRTVDTGTHFSPGKSPVPHTPTTQPGQLTCLRVARMSHLHYHLEFCLRKRLTPEYVPLSLVAGITWGYRKEDTVRLRSCYTLSVCVSFISLNDFRNPDGTQWLSPTTPK